MIQHVSVVQSTFVPNPEHEQNDYFVSNSDDIFDTTVVDGLATLNAY